MTEPKSVRRGAAMATTVALCVAAVSATPTVAQAGEPDVVTAPVVAEALAGVDGSLIAAPSDDSGVGATELGGGTVEVPARPDSGVTLVAPDGSELTIGLPAADEAANASTLADGTIVYPAEDVSNAIIVSDIGVQMLSTIVDSAAPTSFEYDLSLEPGQRVQLIDGGAAVIDADGTVAVAAFGYGALRCVLGR